MKNFILLIFWGIIGTVSVQAQYDYWETLLNDIKVRYVYSSELQSLVSKPKFGEDLQALEGKTISIKGFYVPVNMGDTVFISSHNPSNMCFFCSGAGIESIVEIHPDKHALWKFGHLNIDNYYEAKGILRLNAKDYDHLIYILEDAELVKIIKH